MRIANLKNHFAAWILLLVIAGAASGDVIYVNDDASGSNNGTSWADAYTDMQGVLFLANPGDEIRVATGIYKPGSKRDDSFRMKNGVTIYGGFPNTGDPNLSDRNPQLYETILSGDIGIEGLASDNCFHVVYNQQGTNLDTSAVLDGFTITAGFSGSGYFGGGMANENSSPTISNCIFRSNSAAIGGGMWNYNCSPILTNCIFHGNSASSLGGGLGNSVYCSPIITNCTFYDNTAAMYGGGIYNEGASSITLTNCILWADSAGTAGDEIYNNDSPDDVVTYSNVQSGTGQSWFGAGCIDEEPCFVDAAAGDFHLLLGSPCIDAGNNSALNLPATDFEGDIRIINGIVDMGVDECVYSPATSPFPADGAGMVSVDVELSWTASVDALSHDVWFGTDNPPTTLIADDILDTNCLPDTLDCATLYHWRVDENTAAGTITGDVWSFTTIDGKATAPQPANGASGVSVYTDLSWTAGVCTLSHDVWFGTDNPPTTLIADDITDTNADPGPLEYGVTYYWQVDENTEAGTITGDVWSFRTEIWEIWVDDDYTDGGDNDGHTWGIDAFDNIGAGIDMAEYGTTVYVATGTYVENITLKNGVAVIGAGAGSAVIDGGGSGSVVTSNGCDANTILDGFTITGGSGTTVGDYKYGGGMYNSNSRPTVKDCNFSANSVTGDGGGMYNNNSSPTVTNCSFIANNAVWAGGGMDNRYYSSPTVAYCTFSQNTAGSNGGGIENYVQCNATVTGCMFIGNTASKFGGGMYNNNGSNPTVSYCTFTDNSAKEGGGMHNGSNSRPTVNHCTFSFNTASPSGGGMYNHSSIPTVTNCTFTGNIAVDASGYGRGGGMFNNWYSSITVTNCLFVGNSADYYGGGMYNYDHSSPIVTNCTFSGNTAIPSGGMHNLNSSSATVENSIFWDNVGGEIYDDTGSSSLVYFCDVQGGWGGSGTGNIDADPLFSASELNDFHLKSEFGRVNNDPSMPVWSVDTVTSPCIDAGDPYMDVGNEPEGNGGRINMGYYGGTYQASKSSYVSSIEGDVNGDGKVDFLDFAIMAENWLIDCDVEPLNPACLPK
jgi:hypothetical protein